MGEVRELPLAERYRWVESRPFPELAEIIYVHERCLRDTELASPTQRRAAPRLKFRPPDPLLSPAEVA
jgi:hypothetical protein